MRRVFLLVAAFLVFLTGCWMVGIGQSDPPEVLYSARFSTATRLDSKTRILSTSPVAPIQSPVATFTPTLSPTITLYLNADTNPNTNIAGDVYPGNAGRDLPGQRYLHRERAGPGQQLPQVLRLLSFRRAEDIRFADCSEWRNAGRRLARHRFQPRLYPAEGIPHYRTLYCICRPAGTRRVYRLPDRLSRQ